MKSYNSRNISNLAALFSPKQSIFMVYSIGSTIAQLYKLQTKQNCSSPSANIKTATDRKEKRPVIQLKVHASIFDIIKNNSRQRNTL